MRKIFFMLLMFIAPSLFAQTIKATWQPCSDCIGFRVYQFFDGEKILLKDSPDTFYEMQSNESVVLGVSAYNENGESEVIPRLVVIEKTKPAIVKITVEVE